MCFSVSRIIVFIIFIAKTGYLPMAVSSESIRASEPSKIAFAMSAVSALEGLT